MTLRPRLERNISRNWRRRLSMRLRPVLRVIRSDRGRIWVGIFIVIDGYKMNKKVK